MPMTLDELAPVDRGRVLAAAVDRLVPRPRLEGEMEADWPPPELVEQALAEVRIAAKVQEDDNSATAQRQILNLLNKWMSKQLLKPEGQKDARERLGTKGGLDLRSYHVQFGEDFDQESKQTGIRRGEVRQAINEADVFQHFRPMGEDTTELVSLMAVARAKPNAPNTLLVESRRKKDTLVVCNAWRIFHSDVDLTRANTPLDMLRAFLLAYGLDFTFADRGPTRLVEHEAIPIQGLPADGERFVREGHVLNLLKIQHEAPVPPFHMSAHLRISALGVLEVQLFYVVNISRYQEALRKHGVMV